MDKIFEFQYNYIQNEGNYLIIFKEEGIKNIDLNDIQIKMILSNRIPYLLPIELEDSDFNIKIRYNTTFKTILSSYLTKYQVDFDQRIQILFKIVSIIDDSKIYMLNENNYVINSDFIFISKDYSKIFLTYIPVKSIENNTQFQTEIKRFIEYIFNGQSDINFDFYKKLKDFINCDNFTINDLKRMLIILLDNKNNCKEKKDLCNDSLIEKNNDEVNLSKVSKEQKNKFKKKRITNTPYTDRQKTVIWLSAIFSIALVWKLYETVNLESIFYICLGLTIGILDLVYLTIKFWRPKLIREKVISEVKAYKECCSSKEISNSREDNNDFYPILENLEETVVLKKNKNKAYMIIDNGVNTETINIDSKKFIIGRNPVAADYVDKSRGISRIHVEITENYSEYEIRDLGSKNGTFLNDSPLTPNKQYPIFDGDKLKLANSEYLFKVDL